MSKKIYFLLLTSLCFSCLQYENKESDAKSIYDEIDQKAKKVPDSISTYEEIAKHLAKNTSDDQEKVRALHIWITHNIEYDLTQIDSLTVNKSDVFEDLIIKEVLSNKKGVCMHYAMLFHKMCSALDIQSYYISGYTRDANSLKIADESHAWNAVKLDSSYYFIDNTWAAGYVEDNNYISKFRDNFFLILPKDFIKTHMPFDPIWQLLKNPISHYDFMKGDYTKLNSTGDFNFIDSISALKSQNKETLLARQKKRIAEFGITNALIEQKLEIIENNIWIENYNAAITKLKLAQKEIKLAISENNTFVKFLNKKTPNEEGEEDEMKLVVKKMAKHFKKGVSALYDAKRKLNLLSTSQKKEFQTESLQLSLSINDLETKIAQIKPSIKLHAIYADIVIE